MSNELTSCTISVPNPANKSSNDSTIELSVSLGKKTKNSVSLVNNSPYIQSHVYLEARVLSLSPNSDFLDSEYLKAIEEYVNSYMESQISNYLYKTAKAYNSDIIGFGRYVMKEFLTYEDWNNYNWLSNYKNSFFSVDVDTIVVSSYLFLDV